MSSRTREFANSNWKDIWAIALPSSVVYFTVNLVNLIAIKIVANLGGDAIAAITTGARFYNIFNAMLIGLSVGTIALIAQSRGSDNHLQSAKLFNTSLLISIGLGFAMTLFMLAFTPFLVGLFNISPQAASLSITFVQWFSLFYVPIAAYVTLACGLRASGDARTPMYFAILINVLIVLFTYWGTYGGLGLSAGGIRGAAIGMGMGNLAGICVAFIFWWKKKLPLTPAPIDLKEQPMRIKRVWCVAYPAALEQVVLQVGFLAFLWVVAHYGTAAYAAYGAGVTLLSLSMVIGYGFSIAGSILVGQQLGAGNIPGAQQAGWSAMKISLTILISLAIIIAFFARELANWLVDDTAVAEHTITFIYILCIAQPFIAIDMSLGGALRGAGDTRYPLIAALAGLIVVRFGLAMVFLKMDLSITWIFSAMVFDYMVKNGFYIYRFKSGKWIKAVTT